MEEEKPKGNLILYVILVFLILNLILTAFNFVVLMPMLYHARETASRVKPSSLPVGLDSKEGRLAIFEEFQRYYNGKDYDQLYSMLDEAAQLQFTKDSLKQVVDVLHNMFGNIEKGVYSRYESEVQLSIKWFKLYYQLKMSNAKAILIFTVAQQNNEPYKFYGFNISQQ